MKSTISIGSSPDNEIRYQSPSVSGRHATIIIEGDLVKIRDHNSANGIVLNDQVIHEAVITVEDKIILGDFKVPVKELFEKIQAIRSTQKVDYSKEYKEILSLFNVYRQKSMLISDPPKWPIILRVFLTIVLILILFFTDIIPRQYQVVISILIGLTAIIPSLFNHSATKRREKLDALKIQYNERLVCPKCNVSMIHQSRVYWEGRKSCPNDQCDARFDL